MLFLPFLNPPIFCVFRGEKYTVWASFAPESAPKTTKMRAFFTFFPFFAPSLSAPISPTLIPSRETRFPRAANQKITPENALFSPSSRFSFTPRKFRPIPRAMYPLLDSLFNHQSSLINNQWRVPSFFLLFTFCILISLGDAISFDTKHRKWYNICLTWKANIEN